MKRKRNDFWVTKGGIKIKICDMNNQHLINTINMLERVVDCRCDSMISSAYKTLSILNGEMAQDCIENEIRVLEEEGLDVEKEFPIYKNLVAEAKRRGI